MRLVTTALAGAVTVVFAQIAVAQGATSTPGPSVNVEEQGGVPNSQQYGSGMYGEQNRQSNMPYSQQDNAQNQSSYGNDRDGASGGQSRDDERHARGDGDAHDRHARGDDDQDRHGRRSDDDNDRGRSGGD
jgi:hypothetical protein